MKSFIMVLVCLFCSFEAFAQPQVQKSIIKFGARKNYQVLKRSVSTKCVHFNEPDCLFNFRGRVLNTRDWDAHIVTNDDGTDQVGYRITYDHIVGSSDFQIQSNTCNDSPMPCTTVISFTPSSLGTKTATLVGSYWNIHDDPVVIHDLYLPLEGKGVLAIKEPECGLSMEENEFDADGNGIRKKVDIVGTNISLVYASKRTAQYKGLAYTNLIRFPGYNPEGWSVSLVHRYDQGNQNLFLGRKLFFS